MVLSPVLARTVSPLCVLELQGSPLQAAGTRTLADDLLFRLALQRLDVQEPMGAEAAATVAILAPALASLGPSLHTLQMFVQGDEKLGPAGAAPLAAALQALTGLTCLELRGC